MMEAVRNWLTAVVAVTLLLSVVQMLVPPGNLREIASFLGGLILLAALLKPLAAFHPERISLDFSDYRQAVEQRQAELADGQQEELRRLIESETATYISDKAAAMGLTLQVKVTAEAQEDGVTVPVAAELTGPKSQELSRWLEGELGIPAERQVWNEN